MTRNILKCRQCKRKLTEEEAVFYRCDNTPSKTPVCQRCYEVAVRRSIRGQVRVDLKAADSRTPGASDRAYEGW